MSTTTAVVRQYVFSNIRDPFSQSMLIHEDYHQTQTVKKNKKRPDQRIAAQRLSYRQMRSLACIPQVKYPESMTLWNGIRCGHYVTKVLLENYLE